MSESSTRSEAAYREYLAGRFAPDRNDLDGTKRAVEHLERAVALDTNFAQGFVALAEAYNLIGEKDRAFELLEKQLKTSSVDLLSIRLDPMLDSLRNDARFAEIERKLNLPENPK